MLDRTVLFLLAPVLIIVSAGAASLPRRGFAAAAIGLLALQVLGMWRYQTTQQRKEPWLDAAAVVATQPGTDYPIVTPEGVFEAIALSAALRPSVPRIVVVAPTAALEQFAARRLAHERVDDPALLCSAVAGASGVWVVSRQAPPAVAGDAGFSARSAVQSALRAANATVSSRTDLTGITVELWTTPRC